MDKQDFRDPIKSKKSLQHYLDSIHGEGAGHVDTYFNKTLDTLLVIKIQPEYATRSPKNGYIPVRHIVYSSIGRGFVGDLLVEDKGQNKSELAKHYLDIFKEKYPSEYKVQAWSI